MDEGLKRLAGKTPYGVATIKKSNLIIFWLILIILTSNCHALCFEPDIIVHKQCLDTKCGTGYLKQPGCSDPCYAKLQAEQDVYNKCVEAEQKGSEEQDKGKGEAEISMKRGQVSIKQPDGTWKEMPDKTTLKDGDTIKTDRASTVAILLPDGTEVRIAPNSEFTFHWDGTSFSIKLIIGKIRSWIKKTNRKFEIRTPMAICSVRGTDFIVDYNPDTPATTVYLYEGIVDVDNLKGETFELNAGEMITVDSGGKTSKSVLNKDDWNSLTKIIEPEEELIPSPETITPGEQKTGKSPYLIGAAIVLIVLGAFIATRKKK
ncbi:MAG: FecR family protein [Nanoarchaeota archaeon]|nr:FecR family protein [Nanoarchaeota archaeon]